MEQKKAGLDVGKLEILDFKIIKGSIESPFEFQTDKVEGHKFEVKFDMGFNLMDKLVKAEFEMEVVTQSSSEQEEAKGYFCFAYMFGVENLEELALPDERKKGHLNIDSALANALASVTYSTSRGILLTRFQGTALESFILPIINPNDLLKNEL